ncbi:hypothetical protein [Roseibacillus ishigakijimensis]|uniref:hypothetical protein n=1 Tax=Roseibacillus ishigakijimensis TaxID=454146 RepID=UPI001F27F001|nr:hypothetical protein [Roseibacillus ishigakijimensis]
MNDAIMDSCSDVPGNHIHMTRAFLRGMAEHDLKAAIETTEEIRDTNPDFHRSLGFSVEGYLIDEDIYEWALENEVDEGVQAFAST